MHKALPKRIARTKTMIAASRNSSTGNQAEILAILSLRNFPIRFCVQYTQLSPIVGANSRYNNSKRKIFIANKKRCTSQCSERVDTEFRRAQSQPQKSPRPRLQYYHRRGCLSSIKTNHSAALREWMFIIHLWFAFSPALCFPSLPTRTPAGLQLMFKCTPWFIAPPEFWQSVSFR